MKRTYTKLICLTVALCLMLGLAVGCGGSAGTETTEADQSAAPDGQSVFGDRPDGTLPDGTPPGGHGPTAIRGSTGRTAS